MSKASEESGQVYEEITSEILDDTSAVSAGWKQNIHVEDEYGELMDSYIVDVIVEPTSRPVYYGGFRNMLTGVVYHHAATQSIETKPSRWANAPPRFERQTQTAEYTTKSTQSKREFSTQTRRSGLHQSEHDDKVIVPREYFTSEQLEEVWHEKALIIQCAWRCAMARATAQRLLDEEQEAYDRILAERAEAERKREEEAARNLNRRLNPKTKQDFSLLYDEVDEWRVQKTHEIYAQIPEDDMEGRKKAFSALLSKCTSLLATIDALKNDANREYREKRIADMLEEMATPQEWSLSHIPRESRHPLVSVETVDTLRAKYLKELFDALSNYEDTKENRMETLLAVQKVVNECQLDTPLTRDIFDLAEREMVMLDFGRPNKALLPLRKRIRSAFLLFLESPQFNSSAMKASVIAPQIRKPTTLPSFLQPVGGLKAIGGGGGLRKPMPRQEWQTEEEFLHATLSSTDPANLLRYKKYMTRQYQMEVEEAERRKQEDQELLREMQERIQREKQYLQDSIQESMQEQDQEPQAMESYVDHAEPSNDALLDGKDHGATVNSN